MEPEVDIPLLIQEIKHRPALYDTSIPQYRDKLLKKKMWEEVCCNVYSAPVWTSITSKEKTKYGKEIQTKWNSLRSCFRRDLSSQKNPDSGRKKKRKYIYFDLLQFILPFTTLETNEYFMENERSADPLDDTLQSSDSESTVAKRPKTEPERSRSSCDDEDHIEVLTESNCDDEKYSKEQNDQLMKNNSRNTESRGICEDELFLRSLLPHVKQFSPDQKLQLRIQLLQTVLNFKHSLGSSASTHKRTQQVLDVFYTPAKEG